MRGSHTHPSPRGFPGSHLGKARTRELRPTWLWAAALGRGSPRLPASALQACRCGMCLQGASRWSSSLLSGLANHGQTRHMVSTRALFSTHLHTHAPVGLFREAPACQGLWEHLGGPWGPEGRQVLGSSWGLCGSPGHPGPHCPWDGHRGASGHCVEAPSSPLRPVPPQGPSRNLLLNGKAYPTKVRLIRGGSLPPVKRRRMNWIDAPDDVFYMATEETRWAGGRAPRGWGPGAVPPAHLTAPSTQEDPQAALVLRDQARGPQALQAHRPAPEPGPATAAAPTRACQRRAHCHRGLGRLRGPLTADRAQTTPARHPPPGFGSALPALPRRETAPRPRGEKRPTYSRPAGELFF